MIIPKTIIIVSQPPCGDRSLNLTPGSKHNVVEVPEEYKDKYPNSIHTCWVQGNGEPIRLLYNEFDVDKFTEIYEID